MMYGAAPIFQGEQIVGFARGGPAAGPHRGQRGPPASATDPLQALAVAGVMLLIALWIASRTARPIEQLTAVADRMAGGDLSALP